MDEEEAMSNRMQALNELVEELIDGRDIGYGIRKMSLLDALHDIEAKGGNDLVELIMAVKSGFFLTLDEALEALLRRHLDDSQWYRIRMQDLAAEQGEFYERNH